MKPKSALFYVDHLNEITRELCAKLAKNLDAENESSNLDVVLQQYALEAIGIIFIGTRFGCLQEDPASLRLINTVDSILGNIIKLFILPLWALKLSGVYQQSLADLTQIHEICGDKIERALERHDQDGSLEGTLLMKLIDKCGRDSQLPTVMAIDALTAGVGTAHATSFLLYHLATNPDKQEQAYTEIVQVAGEDGKVTRENISELKYLKVWICQ